MLLVNNKHSQFDYSEVYRQIRTSIEFSNIGKKVNVVNITSSKPGEGKNNHGSEFGFNLCNHL